ncbi:MAG TPA: 30S ribosomal protein S18 [Phycisphaeraceae bacterium]
MAEFRTFAAPPRAKVTFRSSTGKLFVDYKNADELRRYMTPNGKIQGRKKTGLDAHEQRLVAQAIKRARYMGLLPYTSATL